jgi:hypothetical protein
MPSLTPRPAAIATPADVVGGGYQQESDAEVVKRITGKTLHEHLYEVGEYFPSINPHDVDAMQAIAAYNATMEQAGDSRRAFVPYVYERTQPTTDAGYAGEYFARAVDQAGVEGVVAASSEMYARSGASASSAAAANLIALALGHRWGSDRIAQDLAQVVPREMLRDLMRAIERQV